MTYPMDMIVGVYSGRDELVTLLAERCAGYSFVTGAEAATARLVVVDSDAHARLAEPSGKSVVRIILSDGPPPETRRPGELRIPRQAFLAAACDVLAFGRDVVESAIHATALEAEVGALTRIQELMVMSDAEAVSERITRSVLALLGVTHGTLLLHDSRMERYIVSFTNDPAVAESAEFLPGVPSNLLQSALASREGSAIQRLPSGEGLMVLPLQSEDDLIAVVRVALSPEEGLDEDRVAEAARYLSAVAPVLSNVYQLTRSRDLAMRDDLTKAYNRRFFEAYLDEEMERSRRYGSLFSIIFLDLDDLKSVNQRYGHLTGSRTLQEVAKRILGAVRGIDKVVRFGGDEFCILLPQTDQDQAVLVAKRIRRAMTAAPFHLDADVDVTITASFGVATYPVHAVSKESLVRQADAAMYRVKSTTKNAVGIATVEEAVNPANT